MEFDKTRDGMSNYEADKIGKSATDLIQHAGMQSGGNADEGKIATETSEGERVQAFHGISPSPRQTGRRSCGNFPRPVQALPRKRTMDGAENGVAMP